MAKKLFLPFVIVILSFVFLAACGSDTTNEGSDSAPDTDDSEQETSDNETEAEDGDKPYIAIVSKGFQHQFWQAVQSGAERAAEEFDVEITFEGPDNESQIDKQIEMLQAALDRNPDRH